MNELNYCCTCSPLAKFPTMEQLTEHMEVEHNWRPSSTDPRSTTQGEQATGPYPDNNPKTKFGLKKAPIHLVPPALIRGAAEAWGNGAEKYGPFNWREHMISSTVYYAAFMRHVMDWYDRVDADDCAPDSHVHHLKHAVACLGMLLDTIGTPMLNDDRPPRVKQESSK